MLLIHFTLHTYNLVCQYLYRVCEPSFSSCCHCCCCCCSHTGQVLVPHDDTVKIEGASVGEKWLVISQRSRAQQTLVTHPLPAGGAMPAELGEGDKVVFDEPAYTLSGGEDAS